MLAFGAFGLGLAAVGYTVQGLDQPRTTGAWAAAGVSIASWAAIVGLRGRLRTFEEVVGPASLTGVAVAVAASLPHQQHTAMILGGTTVAAALVVGGRFPFAWRAVYAATSAGALFAAHSYAQEAGTGAWQLPAAYGLVLAALLWDSAWNRCQPAMLFVPAVGPGAPSAPAPQP